MSKSHTITPFQYTEEHYNRARQLTDAAAAYISTMPAIEIHVDHHSAFIGHGRFVAMWQVLYTDRLHNMMSLTFPLDCDFERDVQPILHVMEIAYQRGVADGSAQIQQQMRSALGL